jgi:hypothetical protein
MLLLLLLLIVGVLVAYASRVSPTPGFQLCMRDPMMMTHDDS